MKKRLKAAFSILILAISGALFGAENFWFEVQKFPVPDFEVVTQPDEKVIALRYEGEPYRGKKTMVFAYYSSPSLLGVKSAKKFPAVVCVHGGGGKAFPEWVKQWHA